MIGILCTLGKLLELNVPLLSVAAPELVAGVSGESESRIRDLFEQATAIAPCILFFDEIDSIAPHRATAQREMEKRIVTQLLLCIDELGIKENGDKVLIIGATNRPDSLDPALRRAGRFDREVSLEIPDKDARAKILVALCGTIESISSKKSMQGAIAVACSNKSLIRDSLSPDTPATSSEAATLNKGIFNS